MSYVQRVFYTGLTPEPISGGDGTTTLQWVAYDSASSVAPVYPAAGTLAGTGAVVIKGMYSLSGDLTLPGEPLEAEGVARIEVASIVAVPLGTLDITSVAASDNTSYETAVLAVLPAWFWRLDETTGTVAADANAKLVVEGSAVTGMQVLCPDNQIGFLYFF